MEDIPPQIKEKALLILAEIKKARSILLHCHPSPDPDSVGSALAMKAAIEQLGGKATIIRGDSEIPQAFMHFPGAKEIVMKSYWEIDPLEYDLFIVQDSSLSGVSRLKPVQLPSSLKMINIDHHRTNTGEGFISIVDTTYPAVAQLLYDVFIAMNVKITADIAANLFIGIYTDTGFKYSGTTARTFQVAAELVKIYPSFGQLVADMENSSTLGDLAFQGAALSSIEVANDNRVAYSVLPYLVIQEKKIPDISISAGTVSSLLRKMGNFDILIAVVEPRPDKIKLGFRSGNSGLCDVSKLAAAIGGGGHRAAAGAHLDMPLVEARALLARKIKELYNL